jgi:hypothetical protein
MVLDGDSLPLDVGRAKRTAPPGIRRALTFRDGGCSFPTCTRPAPWTDAHHVRHWVDGGDTSLDNMVLLCRRHHTLIHHSEWEVRIRDRLPEFRPPGFVDPQRRPRRNTLHGVRSPLRKRCLTSRTPAREMAFARQRDHAVVGQQVASRTRVSFPLPHTTRGGSIGSR